MQSQWTTATLFMLGAALLTSELAGQAVFVPDSRADVGSCSTIPFGAKRSSLTIMTRYQCLLTAEQLGNKAGFIDALAFAPCSSGVRSFEITIKLDHFSAAGLSNTFDDNLSLSAVTALDSFVSWGTTADQWNWLGLSTGFNYTPASGGLLIDITIRRASFSGSGPAGFRLSHEIPTVSCHIVTRAPIRFGTPSSSGLRVGVRFGCPRGLGPGCPGSNGKTPLLSVPDSVAIGTALYLGLSDTNPGSLAILVHGDRLLIPIDLTASGAPGCCRYITATHLFPATTDASGKATWVSFVPLNLSLVGVELFYQAKVMDPAANAAGFACSGAAMSTIVEVIP